MNDIYNILIKQKQYNYRYYYFKTNNVFYKHSNIFNLNYSLSYLNTQIFTTYKILNNSYNNTQCYKNVLGINLKNSNPKIFLTSNKTNFFISTSLKYFIQKNSNIIDFSKKSIKTWKLFFLDFLKKTSTILNNYFILFVKYQNFIFFFNFYSMIKILFKSLNFVFFVWNLNFSTSYNFKKIKSIKKRLKKKNLNTIQRY